MLLIAKASIPGKRRLPGFRGFVLTLVFALLGPAIVLAQTAAPSPLTPKGMQLYPDTQQGVAGKPLEGKEFSETQQRLLFAVEFDKAAAGTQVDVAIVNIRSAGGLEQVIFASSDKIGADGRLPVALKLPGKWPIGYYAVRIGVNERLIASLPYSIKASAPRNIPIKANGDIKIVRVSDDGKELLMVPTPKASLKTLNFILDTTGVNTGGATVTWTLTALTTSAGNNIPVGSNTVEDWPLENTRLTFDVQLPRDWPTGKYRVETKIGSQLLAALLFDIEP